MSEVSEGSLASEIGTILELLLLQTHRMIILLEKGDTKEQVKLAEAMLGLKLIRALQTTHYRCQKVQKSDDEVAKAVLEVVRWFGVDTQWAAVYRVLADFCGWEDDIAKFTKRMNMLLKDVRLKHPCTYQAIQKPLSAHSILRKSYEEWKVYSAPKGNRAFPRQLFIAKKLLNLLSISD